jgi:hypothetical protein
MAEIHGGAKLDDQWANIEVQRDDNGGRARQSRNGRKVVTADFADDADCLTRSWCRLAEPRKV